MRAGAGLRAKVWQGATSRITIKEELAMLYGILVATTPGEDTAHVTQRAAMLVAALSSATLDIFSVLAPTGTRRVVSWMRGTAPGVERSEQQRTMRRLATQSEHLRAHYGIRCTIASSIGALAAQVAARVDVTGADLIVLGAQEPGWTLNAPGAGEVGRVARMSGRPVLSVRNEPRGPYARVAIPLDFSDDALRITETVMQLLPETHITFLHSYRVPAQGTMRSVGVAEDAIESCQLRAQRQAQAAFSAFLDRLSRPLLKFSLVLTARPEPVAVRSYIRSVKPDLVVLADKQECKLEGWLADSTLGTVFRDTRCDVLLLQPGGMRTGAADPDPGAAALRTQPLAQPEPVAARMGG
jgi:nucleotide-binding universal stress UspA family protein